MVLLKPIHLAIAATSALTFTTQPVYAYTNANSTTITLFKPPTLIPFIHMNLLVEASTYVTAADGIVTGQANNQGGNFTGAISGQVLKLGTEFEQYLLGSNSTQTIYENTYTLNTTNSTPLILTVNGHITYSPTSLYGFARITFSTAEPAFQYLVYGNFVGEFNATFGLGRVDVDVFEVVSGGFY